MEPIKITTPKEGHVVELKTKVTGFDQELIMAEYEKPTPTDGPLAGLPAGRRSNRVAIERMVVSVDGDATDVVAKILGMDLEDYKFVVAEIDKVSEGPSPEKKTDSSSPTSGTSAPASPSTPMSA